jgi:chromatin remodeling complex protein RSC6
MVRPAKTSAEKATVANVAAVSDKPKAVKKAKTPKEVAPVVDAAPVVVSETDSTDSVVQLTAKLSGFGEKINQITSLLSVMKNEYKALEKTISRELKTAQKASQKKKRASGNRAPSGFVKPTLISDELAVFLGKDKGIELARTAVSKEINAYIRAAKLQDPTNGRKINPDAKLAKLLKIAKGDELTYFNLQAYMKHHFIKSAVPAPAPVAV